MFKPLPFLLLTLATSAVARDVPESDGDPGSEMTPGTDTSSAPPADDQASVTADVAMLAPTQSTLPPPRADLSDDDVAHLEEIVDALDVAIVATTRAIDRTKEAWKLRSRETAIHRLEVKTSKLELVSAKASMRAARQGMVSDVETLTAKLETAERGHADAKQEHALAKARERVADERYDHTWYLLREHEAKLAQAQAQLGGEDTKTISRLARKRAKAESKVARAQISLTRAQGRLAKVERAH